MALETEARVAVDWWKQVLLDQPPKNAGSRGDGAMEFAETMGSFLSVQRAPTNDCVERFGQALLRRLTSDSNHGFGHILSCDYGPDADLAEAADEAGVSGDAFPWKTVMWIRSGRVTVRHGYGADEQVLYEEAQP